MENIVNDNHDNREQGIPEAEATTEPSIEQALNRIFKISPELKRKFEIFMIQIIARNKLEAVT